IKKLNYLMAVNDTTGAIREVNSLIDSSPVMPDYLMLKGNLFEALALPDSALTYYRRAEQLEPDNGAIKMTLAGFYKEHGDSVAYDSAIYDALISEDFELEDKLHILTEYLQTLIHDNSDTQRGDYLFSALERQHPHEPAVLDLAARYSAAKGNWRDAIEQISYAIDLNPNEETYRGQLMTYYLSDDNPKAAMSAYEDALSHIEHSADGLQLLYANACSLADYHDKARSIYADLIRAVTPEAYSDSTLEDNELRHRLDYDELVRVSTLYNMLGDSYYSSGEKKKAFVAYDNSLYFMPDNPMTLNNYAYFLTEEGGDLERASAMSRNALDQSPDNDTYIDTYAWIEFKLGHFEEARLYQKKAIEIAEERGTASAELYEHYGDILFMCQEPSEALVYWEKALELDPENVLLKKKVEHKTYFYPENHKK
ncbi:MAG: tetratricopeptide repeat protein, partial [Muribaculaceae bacterium]|nr:tetratricopeptide repeat protein [Muribaculaceae bacterium]